MFGSIEVYLRTQFDIAEADRKGGQTHGAVILYALGRGYLLARLGLSQVYFDALNKRKILHDHKLDCYFMDDG